MSESETRELVTRAFAAFNSGDLESLLACFSDEVAFDFPGADREIGREALRWRLAALSRHVRAEAADIAVLTAPGGLRAAAEFTLRGTWRAPMEGFPAAAGQNFRLSAGVFLDMDDDRLISRLTLCLDPSRLREASAMNHN